MRLRTLLGRAVVAASVLVTASVVLAAPASAGTPYSGLCSDGNGFVETPVMTSPFTIAAEISSVSATSQQIQLCYSTTGENDPGGVTGGWVVIQHSTTISGTSVTESVRVLCQADTGVTLPINCDEQAAVQTFPIGVPAVTTTPIVCLVNVGTGCLLTLSGVGVQLRPVLRVTLPVVGAVDLPPSRCISILGGTC